MRLLNFLQRLHENNAANIFKLYLHWTLTLIMIFYREIVWNILRYVKNINIKHWDLFKMEYEVI